MIVGIDLGTTYSAVAHITADGPRLIPNALGEVLTPSVVGVDLGGKILVGREAKEFQVLHPDRYAGVFKRYMGSDWHVKLAGRKFSPTELSAVVLGGLKKDAEVHLGCSVDRAVITVPAYFNEHQRKATIQAGEMAGFAVERILNEPTAAAIAYGHHESDEEKILLVFDLGGGTFDVSIVELFEGTVEVRSSSGDTFLGGEDFTTTLASRVLESRGLVYERAEAETPLLVSRLLHQCETAKRRLSSQPEAKVWLPNAKGEQSADAAEVTFTREQFETWTRQILARVDLPIRRALGDAHLKPGDVDEVLLVGGATRMPAVVQHLVERFGKEPQRRLNPDEVVAMGAAVQAGLIAREAAVQDFVVTDVAPFTLGVETCKEFGGEHRPGYFLPIIHRNTTLPISRCQTVATVFPNQSEVTVRVYQGEHRRVESNLFLGEFCLDGIPKGPAGQQVEIRFTYDLNGVLEVEATIVETKKKVTHLITKHAQGMTSKQIEKAVREMQALKTHPREETRNRYLLRRAERLFGELSLYDQKALGHLLDGFEDAMDLGDQEAIQRYCEALDAFFADHDFEPDAES